MYKGGSRNLLKNYLTRPYITCNKIWEKILAKVIHQFFETHQKMPVAVNGTTSSEVQVRSSIPQGSVLRPLLFLIHTSDINNVIMDSTALSLADDTQILR